MSSKSQISLEFFIFVGLAFLIAIAFSLASLDQLQDLADPFNTMIGKIRMELKGLKENLNSLKEKLDNISEHEIAEHKRAYLGDLKRIAEEVEKIMHYFKI